MKYPTAGFRHVTDKSAFYYNFKTIAAIQLKLTQNKGVMPTVICIKEAQA